MRNALAWAVAGSLLSVLSLGSWAAAEDSAIEEIVITGLKRESSIGDAPVAVTAFSGAQIEQRQFYDVADLGQSVPGLNVSGYSNNLQVAIRGISTDFVTGGQDPSVAHHVDGVYLARMSMLGFLMSDLDSIEVLRGPQGTLYGRNATGGAINFNTREPTQEFEAEVSGLVGSEDRYRVRGVVSGPLTEQWLGRLSAMVDNRDGYGENASNGDNIDGREAVGVRGSLRILATEALTIDLSGHYYDEDIEGDAFYTLSDPFLQGQLDANPAYAAANRTTEPQEGFFDLEPETEVDSTGVTAIVDWELSASMSVKSITGLMSYESNRRHSDCDGTDWASCDSALIDDGDSFSQELSLSFDAFEGGLTAIVGLYYFEEDLFVDDHVDFLTANPQGFVSIAGNPVPVGSTVTQFFHKHDTTSVAAFADVTVAITERMRVYGGARFTQDEKEITQTQGLTNLTIPGVGVIDVLACDRQDYDDDWNDTSPKVGLQFDVTESQMLYLQWQKGYKSGGFNISACGDSYEPEEIESWEGGYKARFGDGRFGLNVAVFDYAYDDLQVFQIENFSARIDNAAKASVRGAEVEFVATIDRFELDAAVAWLDAEYDEFTNIDTLEPTLGLRDLSGNKLNRAPEYTFNVGAQYTIAVLDGAELTLRTEVFQTDDLYFRAFNLDADRQDRYTLWNLFASFEADGGRWFGRVFGKNLGDEDYTVGRLSSDLSGTILGTYGAPRTWGIELGARM